MPNAKKVATVDQITNKLRENQNVTLIGFEKTSHIALENLRKSLRKTNANLAVVKTSLLEKAIEMVDELSEFKSKALPIKNSTAVVNMQGDWSAGLKAIFDFAKKDPSVSFKIAFLDKVIYDKSSLEKLAQLPSKLELLSKVIGSFKSPINRVDRAIKFPMTYFVNVLKARSSQANG
jgi:large subunit ribosomal protein L10